MSDELKNIYHDASKMDRYYDSATPCELFRGIPKGAKVALMQPTLVGFYKRKQDPNNPKGKIPDLTQGRHPDVLVTNAKTGSSPQYDDGTTTGQLNEEHRKKMEITAEMIKNADDYMVSGCRTMNAAANHRGLSLFNGASKGLPFDWFVIAENTKIPEGLAVTRDADMSKKGTVHHTVAPKDDMTLALYLVQLQALGKDALAHK
jgi:hypothetical protein